MSKTESPFTVLKKWFLNGDINDPPIEIIKALNIRYILQMFSGHKVTPYLNKYFNNYELYKLDSVEFCIFLKELVQDTNIKWNHFTYLKTDTVNKKERELQEKLPHLKKYEIQYLLNQIDDDKYDGFKEYLGLGDIKKKKLTKKQKKELETVDNQVESSNVISFEEWCKNFE